MDVTKVTGAFRDYENARKYKISFCHICCVRVLQGQNTKNIISKDGLSRIAKIKY